MQEGEIMRSSRDRQHSVIIASARGRRVAVSDTPKCFAASLQLASAPGEPCQRHLVALIKAPLGGTWWKRWK